MSLVVEKPAKTKVRAVITVRRKNRENFRDTIANQLDALSDKIGKNVVLELISTEINSSKLFLSHSIPLFLSIMFSDGDFGSLRNKVAEEKQRNSDQGMV